VMVKFLDHAGKSLDDGVWAIYWCRPGRREIHEFAIPAGALGFERVVLTRVTTNAREALIGKPPLRIASSIQEYLSPDPKIRLIHRRLFTTLQNSGGTHPAAPALSRRRPPSSIPSMGAELRGMPTAGASEKSPNPAPNGAAHSHAAEIQEIVDRVWEKYKN